MPILIRNESQSQLVPSSEFQRESDLELLLSEFPDLLIDDEETDIKIKFVDRQVMLEAGRLDLLFVDSEGVPIAVETKLERNVEARREVVAQVIDYLSSLTSLTVDELDQRVNGKLDSALHALTPGCDDSDFDLLWKSVGANLRDGRARLVVVLDNAPLDLQRIFRFLARKSDLDVQLLSVQRYASSGGGAVFVPQILVSPESADRSGPLAHKEQHSELVAVCDAYNATAPQDIRAMGQAPGYRIIRPADWLGRKYATYDFRWRQRYIAVEVSPSHKISSATVMAIVEVLSPFDGKRLLNGQAALSWDKDYSAGRGRLFAQFPAIPPETIAQAMLDLISMTRPTLTQKIKVLTDAGAT